MPAAPARTGRGLLACVAVSVLLSVRDRLAQRDGFATRRDAVYDLIEGLKLPKTAAILEIGCSGGPLMQRLRASGYTDLTGIDSMIRKSLSGGSTPGTTG